VPGALTHAHALTRANTHTLLHNYTHTLVHNYTHTLVHNYTHTLVHKCTHAQLGVLFLSSYYRGNVCSLRKAVLQLWSCPFGSVPPPLAAAPPPSRFHCISPPPSNTPTHNTRIHACAHPLTPPIRSPCMLVAVQIPGACTISGDVRLTPFYEVGDVIAALTKCVV
jgi:hypothetical protein